MTNDEYLEMFEADAIINKTDLTTESLKIPVILAKYQRHLVMEAKILKGAEQLLDKKRLDLYKYYTGDAPDHVYKEKPLNKKPLKSDIEKYYMEADSDFQKLEQQIQNQSLKVRLLEEQIKALSQRSFNIKNAIDWEKFKSGIN